MDTTRVAEIMTPAVFTISLETPAREVVKRMLELKVHQLFVMDEELALVGVISALDVLRPL
jgi:CBS domain-containing protein